MPPVFHYSRTIVIDCGVDRTMAGVFRRRGRRLSLEQLAVEPAARPTRDWLQETQRNLTALRRRIHVPGETILVVPGHLVFSKLIPCPPARPAQREKIIRLAATQALPCDLAELSWGFVSTDEDASSGAVLLAAAKADIMEQLCQAAETAGFTPRLVLPAALATLGAVRLASVTAEGGTSLIIKVTRRSVTLLWAGERRFALRTFPRPGASLPSPEARDAALLQEIARTRHLFKEHDILNEPVHLLVTGEAMLTAGLAESLATALKLEPRTLAGFQRVEYSAPALRDELGMHAGWDLLGAAAVELFPRQAGLNLLPANRKRQLGRRRRLQLWIAAAALVAVALLPPGWHFHQLAGAAQEQATALEQTLAPVRERDARMRANRQRLATLRQQIQLLQRIASARTSWLGLLADLESRLGRIDGVWLDRLEPLPGASLRLKLDGRILESPAPPAAESSGPVARAQALLASVARSPLVTAVEAERFDRTQHGMLAFSCVVQINPEWER